MSDIKSKLSQDGNTLILEIDISKKASEFTANDLSSTGKKVTVASTRGFARYGAVDVSLNVTCPVPAHLAKDAAAKVAASAK